MALKSRLRTKKDKGRRLFTIVLLLLALAAVGAWLINVYNPHVIQEIVESSGIEAWRNDEEKSIIRGTIYDRNYRELAVSYERVSVYANIREIGKLKDVVEPLAAILEEPENTLYERLTGNTLRLWLAKDISQDQEEKIRNLDLPGVFFHKEHVRYHPQGESAAHLIGFVENDSGLAGVEYLLNQLQTKYRLIGEKNDDLDTITKGRPGTDGQHLLLTLDLKIQNIIDRFLQNKAEPFFDKRLGVMVMEAQTGALVGYSQIPSFDPNSFHTFSKDIFRDIFDTPIVVPDVFKVYLRDLSLLKSHVEVNKTVPLWSLIAEKRKLGVQLQLWEALGVGKKDAYDFLHSSAMSEENHTFKARLNSDRDFETVPTMLTPLQIATAVARAVNGGIHVVPHAGNRYFLRKNQSEYLLEDFNNDNPDRDELLRKISREAQLLFQSMGRKNLLNSSTLYGGSSSYSEGERDALYHHGLSLTLVPAKDPELILMMVVEEPGYRTVKKEKSSELHEIDGLIAPVSALQQVMKNLADMMKPKEQEEKNFQNIPPGKQKSAVENEEVPQLIITKMPDLRGMSLRKSLRVLQEIGVTIRVDGTGRVISQQPEAGSVLVGGTSVILRLERDQVDSGKLLTPTNDQ